MQFLAGSSTNKTIVALISVWIVLSGCKDASLTQQAYPYMSTTVSDVTGEGAVFTGEVDLMGSAPVVDYGFVWAKDYTTPAINELRLSLGKDMPKRFSASIFTDLEMGEVYTVRAYAITTAHTVYGSSVSFRSSGSLPPQLTTVSPTHGPRSSQVTLTGKNFGQNKYKKVSLGSSYFMTVVSWSDTQILATVPLFIPSGTHNITVAFGNRIYPTNVAYTVE